MTDDEYSQLIAEKARIEEEIRNYPAPIPACDAQFNYLLERRAEIESALTEGAGKNLRSGSSLITSR